MTIDQVEAIRARLHNALDLFIDNQLDDMREGGVWATETDEPATSDVLHDAALFAEDMDLAP